MMRMKFSIDNVATTKPGRVTWSRTITLYFAPDAETRLAKEARRLEVSVEGEANEPRVVRFPREPQPAGDGPSLLVRFT
jgi:hypothetical protein